MVRTDADAGSGAVRGSGTRTTGGVSILPAREPLPTRVDGLPDLPVEYGHVLDAGLADLRLTLPAGARSRIDDHVRLLLAWTTAINLTAIRVPADVARAHVLDSLSAVRLLRERAVTCVLDLGSGGGFPGFPLALALPVEQALLVEPIGKKARFLETVASATGLADRVSVAPVRAEALAADPAHRGAWPAVTARGVGSLADLVELAFPLLARDGVLVAWKRGDLVAEVGAAQRAIEALGGGTLAAVAVKVTGLAGHRLVVASPRGRIPPGYPRDPSARKRRPW